MIVDPRITREIRRCMLDTSDRGLIIASKWLSELLLSIPPSKRITGKGIETDTNYVSMLLSDGLEDHPTWITREEMEVEDMEADVLDVASKCMQARQYHRAAHLLRNCTSAKACFIASYCQFIMSEKKALHRWHKADNTRHQAPLPVNSSIHDLLDIVKKTSDPWLQFLEALFLQRLSRIPEALTVLFRSLSVCPWNWSAWTLLGQCLDSSEALTDALTEIDLPLDHPLPQMFQIKIMNELHTATTAEIQLCDKLLGPEYFPDSLWLMGQRARALYDTLDHPQALSQFEKMYQLDPTRIEDLDIYSNLLHLLESREKLTALAERFLLTDKDRPEVCCIVGNHYSLRAERDKAVRYFRRATQLDRTCLAAWTLMGLEYNDMANYPAAIESFRKALDINKKDSRPWAGLGASYDAMGMQQYGLYYYKQAVKLRPGEPSIWEGLASCYEQISKYMDGVIALKRAVELLNPLAPLKRRVDLRFKIAKLARNADDPEEALNQDTSIVRMCDLELFNVDLRQIPQNPIGEQYLLSLYNVADYHDVRNSNLKLSYDYFTWLFTLGFVHIQAPKIHIGSTYMERLKNRALAKGCQLTDEDSPNFGYGLEYKEGRVLLLEYLMNSTSIDLADFQATLRRGT